MPILELTDSGDLKEIGGELYFKAGYIVKDYDQEYEEICHIQSGNFGGSWGLSLVSGLIRLILTQLRNQYPYD